MTGERERDGARGSWRGEVEVKAEREGFFWGYSVGFSSIVEPSFTVSHPCISGHVSVKT